MAGRSQTDARLIALGARCELARRNFYEYCKLFSPDFYSDDRPYIKRLCDAMQDFITGDGDLLLLNMPPRFGKSRTAGNLVQWILGKDPTRKIMTGSYNVTLSTSFSKAVRDAIQEIKADKYIPVYSDVFPGVTIKEGDGAMNLWSLNGGYQNYLATSPGGTATGFGANLLIVDDLIKNSMEAYNETVKQGHWDWFTGTMLSRLEEGGKLIIIMTRWASDDLAGRALEHFGNLGLKIQHINMTAKLPDGSMLCDAVLSAKSYEIKRRTMPLDVFSANYQQEPIDLKGCLYSKLLTYEDVPRDGTGKPLFTAVRNYTDTADTGSDWLCSITYGVYDKQAYILDIYYTKDPMEITEPELARRLMEHDVGLADIESNNGGRGFARNVENIMRQQYQHYKTKINPFHQTANKVARILSNSTQVMQRVYFPVNWRDRWPEFYADINKYQREGKNAHDDCADALTGVVEFMDKVGTIKINPKIMQRGRFLR